MARNIISFYAIFKDDFRFYFNNDNENISLYKHVCFYFKDSPFIGIYESVVCVSKNDNIILNVDSS